MTTIGATSQLPAFQYARPPERDNPAAETAPRPEQADASSGAGGPDRLKALMDRLDALKRQQVNMSNHDYLMGSLSLKEEISTERLNAGENLDTFSVEFGGRVFNLAGKVSGPGSLEFARVSDAAEGGIRYRGIDIRV